MKLIGITSENLFDGEEDLLSLALDEGLETLHLRKPQATQAQTEALLQKLSERYRAHIVLHDHYELTASYRLKGIHLNRRNPSPPSSRYGTISRSCHSLSELTDTGRYDYVFLSPVFDSISKTGYSAAFPENTLSDAARTGVIHKKVIALGGITPRHVETIRTYGFGGIAVLGWLWQDNDPAGVRRRIRQLIRITS